MTLFVDSYFEYFLTLLGWIVNNALWDLLTQTGIFVLPLIGHLFRLWLKVREEGDDEGEKGKLLLARLEHIFYVSILVICFTCIPYFQVSFESIEYDTARSMQCNHTAIKPSETGYSNIVTEMDGKSARLPLWWGLMHTINKAVTRSATASIPCKADMRQLRFDVQHTQIESPVLRQEINDFVTSCYIPSRAKIKRQQINIDQVQAKDLDWIGSNLMVNTPGLYDKYRSQLPRKQWPYDPNRDAGLPNTGKGGFPKCKQWWADADIGLKYRILSQVKTSTLNEIRKLWNSSKEYEDIVIRSLVRPQNIEASSGRVYPSFGGDVYMSGSNALTRIAGTVGGVASSVLIYPALDSLRQALPLVQGFFILALIIAIPIVTLMSGYDVKVVVTLSFVQFGLFFLSFWWELARWLDSSLFEVLYNSDTHSSWNWSGLQNSADDIIVGYVMGSLFLVLPVFWMGAMSWAGMKAGLAISSQFGKATQKAEQAGAKGGQMAEAAIKQGAKKAMKKM